MAWSKRQRTLYWQQQQNQYKLDRKKRIREDNAEPYAILTGSLNELGYPHYHAYLRGSLWKTVRARVLGGKCRLCNYLEATQVHHLSYDLATMKGDDLTHLVPVCGRCHRQLEFTTKGKKRSFIDARESCLRRLKRNAARQHQRDKAAVVKGIGEQLLLFRDP